MFFHDHVLIHKQTKQTIEVKLGLKLSYAKARAFCGDVESACPRFMLNQIKLAKTGNIRISVNIRSKHL